MTSTLTQSELTELIEVVQAVQEVAEKTWIPANLDTSQTFFGVNDWWMYGKSYHPNMCHQCDFYGDIHFFNGGDIRLTFPYMEIVDDDTINVNVHPNCSCILTRVLGSVEP